MRHPTICVGRVFLPNFSRNRFSLMATRFYYFLIGLSYIFSCFCHWNKFSSILDPLVCLAVCFNLSVPSVCLFWVHYKILCSWNEMSYIKSVLYHYYIIESSLSYCIIIITLYSKYPVNRVKCQKVKAKYSLSMVDRDFLKQKP